MPRNYLQLKGFTTFSLLQLCKTSCSLHKRGFTLIELLVVISIIAVLSVVGVTVFTNVQKSAQEARRKADINAMIKAYSVRNSTYGSYSDGNNDYNLKDSEFTNGKVPTISEGKPYTIIRDTSSNGLRLCTPTDNSVNSCNTNAANCYCQGTIEFQPPTDEDIATSNSNITYISGTAPGAGGGGAGASPSPTPGGGGIVVSPSPTPVVVATPTPVPTPTPVARPNLLTNSNFENGLTNWVCSPSAGSLGICSIVNISPTDPILGTKVVKIEHNGLPAPRAWTSFVQDNITAAANEEFCLSGSVKKDQATTSGSIYIQDMTTYNSDGYPFDSLTSTSWTSFSKTVRKGTTMTGPRIQVVMQVNTPTKNIQFDNIVLSRGACL